MLGDFLFSFFALFLFFYDILYMLRIRTTWRWINMLKLIHALDMNFNSVKNYYDSFIDKYSDLNCYAII